MKITHSPEQAEPVDPKSKDTSLPGREEEVIVNEQEQTKIINTDQPHESENEGEIRYKEGLEDNNITERKIN